MRKRRKASGGNGLGPWQEHGAMARGTRTKSKREARERADKRERQKGWAS